MEVHQPNLRKPYHSSPIPKDEIKIREMVPTIKDVASALCDICVNVPLVGGQVRPATQTDEDFFLCLTDLFRCYRWLSASVADDHLKEKDTYARFALDHLRKGIEVTERIIPFSDPSAAHPWIRVAARDAMSCGVQVLANCTRQCPEIQNLVWPEFFEIIGSLIILEEDKLLNYIAAAVMNCLNDSRVVQMVDRGYAARIFERISVFGNREDSISTFEAIFDLALALLHCPIVAQRDFDLLTLSAKCVILDLLKSCFSLNAGGENPLLPSFWPERIALEFKNNPACLLRLKDSLQHGDEECALVLKTLNIMASLTASEHFRPYFACDAVLLDKVMELFVGIDDLSCQSNNQFSAVLKLSDVKPHDLITPSRGIKSQLLRLLANLVYSNPEFEKRIKSSNLSLLERLKKNARIDYRNPYVQQWAILAIRNLHFSAAMEELRKQHEEDKVENYVPGVAHSVDGDYASYSDAAVERKFSYGFSMSPMKRLGIQHSDTVEALDLHIRNPPTGLDLPRRDHQRLKHPHPKTHNNPDRSGKSRKSKGPVKADRETQTENSTRVRLRQEIPSSLPELKRGSLENLTEGDEDLFPSQERPRFQSR